MTRKAIKIEGMRCQKCATQVEIVLNSVDGIIATVDFPSQTAFIETDSTPGDQELHNMIEFAGCKVIEITTVY